MAKKKNASLDEIDLTTFSWINAGGDPAAGKPGCGGCHPGGGGLEVDRDGNRFDDHLRANPGLATSPDGDYLDSRWDQSGVVEADCFICHLPGYYFKTRLQQLQQFNFKWASVAGSGIGTVAGSVADGRQPEVAYNSRYFNNDGKIVLNLASPPPSENCAFCHGKADLIKRGFSWDDRVNHDVHNLHGLACTHCHPGDLNHNFDKGNENLSTVRDDLDNTMRNCRECHYQGFMGAPTPAHLKIRPNHLDKLACETCHIPSLKRAAAAGLDLTTGKVTHYTRPGADAVGQVAAWQPDLQRDEGGKLWPVNHFAANLYTNQDVDGIYYPLFLREIQSAYETVKDRLDTAESGRPVVDSKEEIEAMLAALKKTLAESRRFDRAHPCYHSDGKVYFLDEAGGLSSQADASWANHDKGFNISHNVAPTRMALGSNGCFDCHSEKAHIFASWISGRLGNEKENPTVSGAGALFGNRPWIYYLNEIHEHNYLKPYVVPVILLVFFLLALFFVDGRADARAALYGGIFSRPTVPIERWVHGVRMVSFLLLAFSGYLFLYNNLSLMELFFNTPHAAVLFHWSVGILFVLASLIGIVHRTSESSRFSRTTRRPPPAAEAGRCAVRIPEAALRAMGRRHLFMWVIAALSLLMGITGVLMIFRESFGVTTKYGLSLMHASGALVFLSVVAAHAYLRISAHIGMWRRTAEAFGVWEWRRKESGNLR